MVKYDDVTKYYLNRVRGATFLSQSVDSEKYKFNFLQTL